MAGRSLPLGNGLTHFGGPIAWRRNNSGVLDEFGMPNIRCGPIFRCPNLDTLVRASTFYEACVDECLMFPPTKALFLE